MIFQKTAANITFTVEHSGHEDEYTVTADNGKETVKGEVSFASRPSRKFVSPGGFLFPQVPWLKDIAQKQFSRYLVQLSRDAARELGAAILADYNERHPVKPKMSVAEIKLRLAELETEARSVPVDDENAKHLNRMEKSQLEWALKSQMMTPAEDAELERKVRISDWVLSDDYDNE